MEQRKEIGARMSKLREKLGLTQQRAAKMLGIDRARLSGMERGQRPIEAGIISRMARLYGVSAGFLLGLEEEEGQPEQPAVFRFRSNLAVQDRAADLLGFLTFLERYRWLMEWADEEPFIPDLPRFEYASNTRTYAVEADARRLRNAWGLGDAHIGKKIFGLLEDHGIGVYRQAVPDSDVSGAYYRDDVVGPTIYVNAKEWPYRQVFTAAHELAHLAYEQQSGYSERMGTSSEERICNRFASAFLMPEGAIETHLASRGTRRERIELEDVLSLHRSFGVSYFAMLVRLRALGIIKQDRYEELSQTRPVVEALQHGFIVDEWEFGYDPKRVPFEQRAKWVPRKFVALVQRALNDGELSDRKAAEYLNLTSEEWRSLSHEPDEEMDTQQEQEEYELIAG